MKKIVTMLLVGLLWHNVVHANETRPTVLLRPLQIMCEDAESLDQALGLIKKNALQDMADINRISNIKSCFPSFEFTRIAEVGKTERNGRFVVCYRSWDITHPEPPDHGQVWCSTAEAIQTIDQLIASRTGKYKMEMHEVFNNAALSVLAMARCLEGGSVSVTKENGQWMRRVSLNIASPQKSQPFLIPQTFKLDDVIREGCRGIDYE